MKSSNVPGFDRQPGFPMSFRPVHGSVCVEFEGTTIANSTRAMVMDEDGLDPVYYFPQDDVRMDLLSRTQRSSH